jgi:hypothetical protein
MRRAFRYVVDHGELYRMTETRFRRYLLAGTSGDRFPDCGDYGVNVGTALTVNRMTPADFQDEYNREAHVANGRHIQSRPPTHDRGGVR